VFLEDSRIPAILGNTVALVLTAATLSMALAAIVAWVVVRSQARGAGGLDVLTFMPTAMPGILVALALLLFAIGTPLQGTVWLIAIGHLIRYLPFATRTMHAGVLQIQKELEEAGRVSGAGGLNVFRRIVVPLVTPALVNGWLWVAAHSLRDVTFPLMLVSGTNTVIGMLLWEYWARGQVTEASATAVFLVVVLVLLVLPLRLRTTSLGADRV
jgi:iron(III) transport system permease protein